MTLSRRFWELYESNAVDASHYDFLLIFALLLAEFVLGYLIIANVAYTEIDWEAYMEEVSAVVVDGQLDYREIRGSTGPLVYPAGFVYLFAFLRQITQQGQNIRLAQFIFLGFYVATQATVLLIYQMVMQAERQRFFDDIDNTTNTNWMTTTTTAEDEDNKSSTGLRKATTARSSPSIASQRLSLAHRIWCWRILLCVVCASKRLHSIFMLRLFNDGPTMLFLYMSMLLFMKQCWQWGCFIFSLAVSVKMNVLLYAPGLLLLLLQQSPNLWTVIVHRLFLGCALPQLVLGAPFLATYPISYLRKAFELDRVFFHKWTVNLKFLPNDIFVSKPWSLFLLCLHLSGLVVMTWKWLDRTAAQTRVQYRPGGRSEEGGLLKCLFLVPTTTTTSQGQLAPDYIAYTLMVSNFVGIAFARTLHYQFYVCAKHRRSIC